MLTRHITPIAEITRRAPEAGRIRLGVKTTLKNGKVAPKAIGTLRFTSPDKTVLDQIAAKHGGEVKAWSDPMANPSSQWEVITVSKEVRVYLPADGMSTWYELWKQSGGCQRRCDGVTCTKPELVGESDYEMVEVDCICGAEGKLACTAVSRLTVILPDFHFLGTWRLDTKGWNAHQELPGMYDMIQTLAQRGRMVDAVLSVEQRERQTPRGKRNFVVPRLAVRTTVDELAAGPQAPAIGTGAHSAQSDVRELTAGGAFVHDELEEIAEAELVTPELLEAEQRLRADADNFGLDADTYVEAVRAQAQGKWEQMRKCSDQVRAGVREPLGFANNRVQWRTT